MGFKAAAKSFFQLLCRHGISVSCVRVKVLQPRQNESCVHRDMRHIPIQDELPGFENARAVPLLPAWGEIALGFSKKA
jgi:hypothetical protein